MELKVWVEGIQRIVCGVTDATTCQDVVYVLVHATGKTGRFTLVEKWRNNERLLPPHEHPLKVLSKWGEYASDVQLVLRRSAGESKGDVPSPPEGPTRATPDSFHGFTPPPQGGARPSKLPSPPSGGREGPIKKSLTFSGGRPNQGDAARRDWSEVPRGVVKGVPQQLVRDREAPPKDFQTPPKDFQTPPGKEAENEFRSEHIAQRGVGGPSGSNGRTSNPGSSRPSRIPGPQTYPGPAVGPPQGPRILRPPDGPRPGAAANGPDASKSPGGRSPSQEPRPISKANGDERGNPPGSRRAEMPGASPASQSNGAPPGRSKESPSNHGGPYSPRLTAPNPVPIHLGTPKSRRNLLSEFKRHDLEEELREDAFLGRGHQERVVYDARYRELVRLINLQREKLSHQQADLTQFDAEILYWEEKQKDHQRQLEVIEREIQKSEFCGRDTDEEIAQLDKLHLEDELEIGRQQEKMLQSELTLLRSKLSNCETELLQCKNKIRLVMDDITEGKRWLTKEEEERKQREVTILDEIDELQREIQDVFKGYDFKVSSWEKVEQDVRRLEMAIGEKKKQVEGLVQEMKEANLESLAFTPSEEIRNLLEGGAPKGPGSSRKIVGSPRQLENAVPTSKNPHGVWV